MTPTTKPADAKGAVDVKAAVDHLMRFLAVDGVSGEEKAIAAAVTDALKKAGVPASAIRFDTVDKRIPMPTQTGNLIVTLPGTRPGPRLALLDPSGYRAALRRRKAQNARVSASWATARRPWAATTAPAAPCWSRWWKRS